MATMMGRKSPAAKSRAPDGFEKFLAVGTGILLVCVAVALLKGQADWGRIPPNLWVHLGTMITALALTPVMLLRRRGDRPHRVMGTIWVGAMIATALVSLTVRQVNDGGFSLIHILSAWTLLQVPIIWWTARTHRVDQHRGSARGMVLGALLIAGFFTFPFNRMLGQFLFR